MLQLKSDPLEMPEKQQLKAPEILYNFSQIKVGRGEVIVLVHQLRIQILRCSCSFSCPFLKTIMGLIHVHVKCTIVHRYSVCPLLILYLKIFQHLECSSLYCKIAWP